MLEVKISISEYYITTYVHSAVKLCLKHNKVFIYISFVRLRNNRTKKEIGHTLVHCIILEVVGYCPVLVPSAVVPCDVPPLELALDGQAEAQMSWGRVLGSRALGH